jgi:hypothetical protein
MRALSWRAAQGHQWRSPLPNLLVQLLQQPPQSVIQRLLCVAPGAGAVEAIQALELLGTRGPGHELGSPHIADAQLLP